MNEAGLEFLTENAGRRYPLAEDCSALDSNGSQWPNGAILDIRGFTRLFSDFAPQLSTFAGSASAGVALPGHLSLWFSFGLQSAPRSFRVDIPDDQTQWPATFSAAAADPLYPGCLIGSVRVTVGAGIREIPSEDSGSFEDGSAPIEPGLIADLFHQQVDSLTVIPKTEAPFVIGSNLRVKGGHNICVTQSGARIHLSASVGSGEEGEFSGETGLSVCSGALRFINGLPPDERGNFRFVAGRGVRITAFREEHLIVIEPDLSQIKLNC